ncbi:patatin-like phospholipase domain-containing protein 2 [Penaeus japonicus]|uniref:patatin-like phospholipase domain-containing protein 2 n=1 Tax=Penaeus japonicus TaxID=27405 RepID=UPI001C70B014|nr:patatin-like phospholipase domain-containing protein 2 [Penaeus japonicus]
MNPDMDTVKRLDDSEGWTTMDDLEKHKIRRPIDSISGVTFCGCGFLGVYLVGVASYLQEHVPCVLEKQFGGSSVGSLVAICLICDIPLYHIRQKLLATAKEANNKFLGTLNPSFSLETPLLRALLDLLPEDAHIKATGRLFLSLTKASRLSNELVSDFKTRKELVQAIICCCYVPIVSGFSVPSFKGNVYVDGAMSNNMPLKGPNTLSVHAFAGDFDICPEDESLSSSLMATAFNQRLALSLSNVRRFTWSLVPPEPEELDKFYFEGYADARRCITQGFKM